jgi:hypothetical protein
VIVGRFALLCLAVVAVAAPRAAAAEPAFELDAGDGQTLVVDREPLRIALRRDGADTIATVPAGQGAPVRPPGLDGPQPAEPLGGVGGFPALGWVTGLRGGLTWPLPVFTGNRMFGGEGGVLVSATAVERVVPTPEGARLDLATDAPGAGPAQLVVERLPGAACGCTRPHRPA